MCTDAPLLEMDVMADDFTAHLRWLFDHAPGPDGERVTTEGLVALINGAGQVHVSTSYANQLRRGAKSNPSVAVLEAIAKAFAVPVAFFFDDEVRGLIQVGVTNLEFARDSAIEEIQASLESLTADQLARLLAIISTFTPSGEDPVAKA